MQKIQTEFEDVLLELSYDTLATHKDAVKKAEDYVRLFTDKKHLTQSEQREALELCMEMVSDWFPDCSIAGF